MPNVKPFKKENFNECHQSNLPNNSLLMNMEIFFQKSCDFLSVTIEVVFSNVLK
jgi:hypothetical protein